MTKQHTTQATGTQAPTATDREPTAAELQAIEDEGDIVEAIDVDELLRQIEEEEEG